MTRRIWTLRLIGMVMAIPSTAGAQEPVSHLGLTALAAVGVHGGYARLEHSSSGQEGGLLLDLGWLRGRSVRLQGELAFLRASLAEFVELEDSTFRGNYYDLSVGVTSVWLAAPAARVSPYVLAGVAVHSLTSAFGTLVLDQRYNANRFGSHIGAGVRARFGDSRQALFVEARRIIADEVDRTVIRLGALVLTGDLYRRTMGILR
jgi:hypothetical protein